MSSTEHVPQPGDIYVVVRPFRTLGTKADELEGYVVGDKLVLHETTDRDPFGHKSKLGNWIVECKHYQPPSDESVWSMIWTLIERGDLVWNGLARRVALPQAKVIK